MVHRVLTCDESFHQLSKKTTCISITNISVILWLVETLPSLSFVLDWRCWYRLECGNIRKKLVKSFSEMSYQYKGGMNSRNISTVMQFHLVYIDTGFREEYREAILVSCMFEIFCHYAVSHLAPHRFTGWPGGRESSG